MLIASSYNRLPAAFRANRVRTPPAHTSSTAMQPGLS
eukprot:COSAG02_NODE_5073_length_4666_cov_2.625137_1_plen_36_part_10